MAKGWEIIATSRGTKNTKEENNQKNKVFTKMMGKTQKKDIH